MSDGVFQAELEIGGKTLYFETGKIAKQADSAFVVTSGETVVLVTAVSSDEPREGIDFFPLTVDVEEKMYAVGKIPGGFFRREGRPSEKAILTARLIDRPIRPCFPEGFRNDVQIIASILSVDQINPPDILAINAASLALTVSDIPFEGPIAAVRVGYANGEWFINPTYQEIEFGLLDLVVAGREYTENGQTKIGLIMVEAGAAEVKEEMLFEAFKQAEPFIQKLIEFQKEVQRKIGKPKTSFVAEELDPEIVSRVSELALPHLKEVLHIFEKNERELRIKNLKETIVAELKEAEWEFEEAEVEKQAKKAIDKLLKQEMRKMIVEENVRADGRRPEEIRPISCEVGLLPRTHGSGLFTRGQTQVLSVATLGTASEEQILDGLEAEESKRFIHHYNFPPFSTGEAYPLRGPRRREIGHGALAERALLPVIPPESEFPYTIRVVSEVLESNGSTSMASVCASTLALMDAGIPIKRAVAGIAMGLIKEGEKVVILTDILGMEDALGDMDFKVAGTTEGVTALQMDIKITGISAETLKDALLRAKEARLFILDKMRQTISEPRPSLSPHAPRIFTLRIPQNKIGDLIGPGGRVIKGIIDETGVSIDIEPDGTVFIASKDEISAEKAREIVESITREIRTGERFLGTVTRVADFGAFVEIIPGKEGLVHISKLSPHRVRSAKDVVKVGDKLLVEVVEIDSMNRVNLASVSYLEHVRRRPSPPKK